VRDSPQSTTSPTALSADRMNVRFSGHTNMDRERYEPIPATQAADDHINMNLWEETLPPSIEENSSLPIFSENEHISGPTVHTMAPSENLVFADLQNPFPDADALEQYWNHTNMLDPSLVDLIDVAYTRELFPESAVPSRAETHVFKSPLRWVASWSVEEHRNNRKYIEKVEQRAFNLPQTSEINKLVQLYFVHAHHLLPVLNERYFYRLIHGEQGDDREFSLTPISLALLYAIMFFACTVRVSHCCVGNIA
jgi:hypothetical protein